MADILQHTAYEPLVLDGDASNPEGLVRLLFGLGVEGGSPSRSWNFSVVLML